MDTKPEITFRDSYRYLVIEMAARKLNITIDELEQWAMNDASAKEAYQHCKQDAFRFFHKRATTLVNQYKESNKE